MKPDAPLAHALADAVRCLRNGQLVAFPTETVYGLGADARDPDAVRRIFETKGRPSNHPVIVHLADVAQLDAWAEPHPLVPVLADQLWPGPLTLILRRRPDVPDAVSGGRPTIGIRIPSHPVARALLVAFGGGIAAPSANRFGRVSPTTAAHVRDELGDRVFVLDGGPSTVGLESTIVDLSQDRPALLRPGGVPAERLEALLGPLGSSSTVAPGTLPAHYAPSAAVVISRQPDAEAARLTDAGHTVAILRAGPARDHARRLYGELRAADRAGATVVVAEHPESGGLGDAILDRLQRAAVGSPLSIIDP